jgi:hypothetical protein
LLQAGLSPQRWLALWWQGHWISGASFSREAPITLLIVSHDRRLLETACSQLWVVEAGVGEAPALVAPFGGGYREWRAAVGDGWTVAGEVELQSSRLHGQSAAVHGDGARDRVHGEGVEDRQAAGQSSRLHGQLRRLSKDAYRRRKEVVEEDLSRLGLRKGQLELALGDPKIQANFVELRRVTSELADVDAALAQAEDAWLTLAEQAPS